MDFTTCPGGSCPRTSACLRHRNYESGKPAFATAPNEHEHCNMFWGPGAQRLLQNVQAILRAQSSMR